MRNGAGKPEPILRLPPNPRLTEPPATPTLACQFYVLILPLHLLISPYREKCNHSFGPLFLAEQPNHFPRWVMLPGSLEFGHFLQNIAPADAPHYQRGARPRSHLAAKSEARSPKEGRVPKSEDRNPRSRAIRASTFGLRPSGFGLRPSGFGFPHAFGLRI